MGKKLELAKIAEAIGDSDNQVHVTPAENSESRQAKINDETRRFWLTQFWTGVVFLCLVALCVYLLGKIESADSNVAQWARSGVLSTVSAAIAFVVGRLSAQR
jgi:hypothetical protein